MSVPARRSAILGAFLGDALALGLHWNYDSSAVAQQAAPLLADGIFTSLAAPGFGSHHAGKAAGDFTHYGDQTMVLLESIAESDNFDLQHFFTQWQALFEDYDGYVDGATRGTKERILAGADAAHSGAPSHDLAGASRMAPLLAIFDQESALVAATQAQTKMTHNTLDILDCSAFLARTACSLLAGEPMEESLRRAAKAEYPSGHIAEWVEDGLDTAGMDSVQAIADLGQSCSASGALPAVVHLAATYDGEFAKGLTQNVLAGGDSAARGLALGMLLGAQAGVAGQALPKPWLDQMQATPRIMACLERTLGPV